MQTEAQVSYLQFTMRREVENNLSLLSEIVSKIKRGSTQLTKKCWERQKTIETSLETKIEENRSKRLIVNTNDDLLLLQFVLCNHSVGKPEKIHVS